ncbi:MAG: hypothetical protein HOP19_28400 [Acidobacteria bacterium]|nr:hypothetical protein [Acidobacteriota bacterium]
MQQYRNHLHRFGKIIPFVGIFWVLANANQTLKRKGYVFGTVEVLLDICPVVCIIKAAIESYTGDLIPAKPAQARPGRPRLHAVTADA